MKRLISIDIAKAICIILVVVGHYHPDNAPEWYGIIIRFIYTFHMPLFIFASGYIYAATNRGGDYDLSVQEIQKAAASLFHYQYSNYKSQVIKPT